jgi:hypothetical protein
MKTTTILAATIGGKTRYLGYWTEGGNPKESFEIAEEAARKTVGKKATIAPVAILAGHHSLGTPDSADFSELDHAGLEFAIAVAFDNPDGSIEEALITDKGTYASSVYQGSVDLSEIFSSYTCMRQLELQDEYSYFQVELLNDFAKESGIDPSTNIANSGITWGQLNTAITRGTMDFSLILMGPDGEEDGEVFRNPAEDDEPLTQYTID